MRTRLCTLLWPIPPSYALQCAFAACLVLSWARRATERCCAGAQGRALVVWRRRGAERRLPLRQGAGICSSRRLLHSGLADHPWLGLA